MPAINDPFLEDALSIGQRMGDRRQMTDEQKLAILRAQREDPDRDEMWTPELEREISRLERKSGASASARQASAIEQVASAEPASAPASASSRKFEDNYLDPNSSFVRHLRGLPDEEPRKPEVPKPEESGALRRFAGDPAIDIARGVVDVGEGAVGLADLASFGYAGKALSYLGYDPKATHQILSDLYSTQRKRAETRVNEAKGFLETMGELFENPSALIGRGIESVPSMLGIAATGRRLAVKIFTEAAEAAGGVGTAEGIAAGQKAVHEAAGKIMTRASVAEGALSAGQTAEQARQEGHEFSQYALPSIAAGAGTAAIGKASGVLAGSALGKRLGLADPETLLATAGLNQAGERVVGATIRSRLAAIGQGAAGGIAKEGLLEEAPQSAWEQVMQNLATGRPAGEGVGEATAQGLVIGGAMGGVAGAGAGALRPRAPAETTVAGEAPAGAPPVPQPVLAPGAVSPATGEAPRVATSVELREMADKDIAGISAAVRGERAEPASDQEKDLLGALRQNLNTPEELAKIYGVQLATETAAPAQAEERALFKFQSEEGRKRLAEADIDPIEIEPAAKDGIITDAEVDQVIAQQPAPATPMALADFATKEARAAAETAGLDPLSLTGRGRGRKITLDDVNRAIKARDTASLRRGVAAQGEPPVAPRGALRAVDMAAAQPILERQGLTATAPESLPDADAKADFEIAGRKLTGTRIGKQSFEHLQRLAGLFGKELVLYDQQPGKWAGDGFVQPGNRKQIFLSSVTQAAPHMVIFGHELMHTMEEDMPAVHARLKKAIMKIAKPDAIERMKEQYRGAEKMTDDAIWNEIVSDMGGNRLAEVETWKKIFKGLENHGMVMRVATYVRGAVGKIINYARGHPGFITDDYMKDLERVREAVSGAAISYIRFAQKPIVQEERKAVGAPPPARAPPEAKPAEAKAPQEPPPPPPVEAKAKVVPLKKEPKAKEKPAEKAKPAPRAPADKYGVREAWGDVDELRQIMTDIERDIENRVDEKAARLAADQVRGRIAELEGVQESVEEEASAEEALAKEPQPTFSIEDWKAKNKRPTIRKADDKQIRKLPDKVRLPYKQKLIDYRTAVSTGYGQALKAGEAGALEHLRGEYEWIMGEIAQQFPRDHASLVKHAKSPADYDQDPEYIGTPSPEALDEGEETAAERAAAAEYVADDAKKRWLESPEKAAQLPDGFAAVGPPIAPEKIGIEGLEGGKWEIYREIGGIKEGDTVVVTTGKGKTRIGQAALVAHVTGEKSVAATGRPRGAKSQSVVAVWFDKGLSDGDIYGLDKVTKGSDEEYPAKGMPEKVAGAEKTLKDYGVKDPDEVFPAPRKSVQAEKKAGKFIPQAKANELVESWKAEAMRMGREEDHSNEVVLSLFDYTGTWSEPWSNAGYHVVKYDVKSGDDLLHFLPTSDILKLKEQGKRIIGVLAAPPCTSFASSGNQWWPTQHDIPVKEEAMTEKYGFAASRYFDTPLDYAKTLVAATAVVVEMANPERFHAAENPIGRMRTAAGLPEHLLIFQPHHYGDAYTKETMLWGDFNPELPTANVNPAVEAGGKGSLMHTLGSKSETEGGERSVTPEGFAYAFFMANRHELKKPVQKAVSKARTKKSELRVPAQAMEAIRRSQQRALTPEMKKASEHLLPKEAAKLKTHTAQKIVDIMKTLPTAKEMAAVAHAGRAKRGWYARSARALLSIFGEDTPRFAALLAAMSPQVSVESNLRNALTVWKNWVKAGRPTDSATIENIMGDSVQQAPIANRQMSALVKLAQAVGVRLGGGRAALAARIQAFADSSPENAQAVRNNSVLLAWVPNAIRALTHEDPIKVILSGPKVDSFMRNLLGNVDEVTNDAWMAAYAYVDQDSFAGGLNELMTDPGKGTGYLAMSARTRETAQFLTDETGEKWTPAEVQETIWSWVKTLYEASETAGETRTMPRMLQEGAITDKMIGSTPDFGRLLNETEYARLLEDAGLTAQSALGEGAVAEPRAGREAAPFDRKTQERLENQAARRLERLKRERAADEAVKRSEVRNTPLSEVETAFGRADDGTPRLTGEVLALRDAFVDRKEEYAPGVPFLRHRVVGRDNGAPRGELVLAWQGDKIDALRWIKAYKKKSEDGERMVRDLLAHNAGDNIYVQMIMPEAETFWRKMGVVWEKDHRGDNNGYLTQAGYEKARSERVRGGLEPGPARVGRGAVEGRRLGGGDEARPEAGQAPLGDRGAQRPQEGARPEERRPAPGAGGEAEGPDLDFTRKSAERAVRSIPWYSELSRKIDAGPNSAPAAAWKGYINGLKQKGVKAEEIEWSGLLDYLDVPEIMGTGNIPKQKLLNYLTDNGVSVDETQLGGTAAIDFNIDRDWQDDEPDEDYFKDNAKDFYLDQAREELMRSRNLEEGEEPDEEDVLDHAIQMAKSAYYDDPERAQIKDIEATVKGKKYKFIATYQHGDFDIFAPANQGNELDKRGGESIWDPRSRVNQRSVPDNPQMERVISDYLGEVLGVDFSGEGAPFEDYTLPGGENYGITQLQLPAGFSDKTFRSSHFDESNILAHVRTKDRKDVGGKKVLFVEEVQSDWAQEGREKGFTEPGQKERIDALRIEASKADDDWEAATSLSWRRDGDIKFWEGKLVENPGSKELTDKHNEAIEKFNVAYDEARRLDSLRKELNNQINRLKGGVPAAPFVKKTDSWVQLALKRMVMKAVAEGYDKVAWTTGEQQADRYRLDKRVSSITISEGANEWKDSYFIDAWDLDTRQVIREQEVKKENLGSVIGKELAVRAVKDLQDGEKSEVTYRGLDLNVGTGTGMRTFYDQIVPKVMNDVLKKLGGPKVGTVELPAEPDNRNWGLFDADGNRVPVGAFPNRYTAERYAADKLEQVGVTARALSMTTMKQPGFDITPELSASLEKGVPLFSQFRNVSDEVGDAERKSELRYQPKDQAEADRLGEELDALAQSIRDAEKGGVRLEAYINAAGELHVANLEVPPGERGQGAGQRMMRKLLDWADSKNLQVSLDPRPDRGKKGALARFYKGLGFIRSSSGRYYDPSSGGELRRRSKSERGGAKFSATRRLTHEPSLIGAPLDIRSQAYYMLREGKSEQEVIALLQDNNVRDPKAAIDTLKRSSLRNYIANAISQSTLSWPYVNSVRDKIADVVRGVKPGEFNLFHRTVGTQFHKATVNPEFKKVYDLANKFMDDIAMMAIRSENAAPTIFKGAKSLLGISNADNQLVGKALADGTLWNGGQPGRPDPHNGKRWTHAELRSLYKMTPEQIAIYDEARASINQSLTETAKALMAEASRTAGVPLDQIQALIEQNKTLDQTRDDFIAALPSGKKSAVSAADTLRKTHGQTVSLMAHGYYPLSRFGKFTVEVRDAQDEVQHFSMHESESERNRVARVVGPQYPGMKLTTGQMNEERHKLLSGVTPATMEAFVNAMPYTGAQQEEARQEYLRLALNNRSAMKRMIERKGTAGYSQDAVRSIASFITSNARYGSRAMNGAPLYAAAMNIPKEQGNVSTEATKLYDYLMNPGEGAPAVRGFLFAWFLGSSVAAGLVNLTQPVLMTLPYLSQWGIRRAAATMGPALRDVSDWFFKKSVSDPLLNVALKKAKEKGIIAPQEIFQLMAAAQSGVSSTLAHNIIKLWGWNFATTEVFNRTLSFAWAFRTARGRGMNPTDAYDFAANAVRDTQGLYNKANRPNWARETGMFGTAGTIAFTFKQFSIAYVEFLRRLWTNGQMPKKALLMAIGTLALAAGADGLPGADDIDDILETVAAWLGIPLNMKKEKRKFLQETLGLGTAGTEFAMHGVSSFLPWDLHARLGAQNLIPGTALLNPTRAGAMEKTYEALEVIGPAGGAAKQLAEGAQSALKGNLKEAGQAVLPKAVRDLWQGAEMIATGKMKDPRSRLVMEATPAEGVGRTLGFNPEAAAREQRIIGEVKIDQQIVTAKKSELHQRIAQAIAETDPGAREAALADWRAWNARYPDYRFSLNQAAILKLAQDMRRTRAERVIRGTPKEMRRGVREALTPQEE